MNMSYRENQEAWEHQVLSPAAACSDQSKGRARCEVPDAYRTCYQCDRDRILHAKAFRRLAHKTQVFLAPEGDHYRTRLIHTLEVSQVARSIARPLGLNEDLVEAIALAHDVGHTPFGHAGERALTRSIAAHWTPDDGEKPFIFKHFEQSVRTVELLERNGEGLNLTFEVIDGIGHHSGTLRAQTLEGRVVALADRITYVVHDIDDAKRAGVLKEDDLPADARIHLGSTSSERIERMVVDIVETSAQAEDICMSQQMWDAMMEMRHFLFQNLYTKGDAKTEEPKADRLIGSLYEHLMTHPDEIPAEYKIHDDHLWRQVSDYIAGMTDRYAIRRFEELTVPHAWARR